jgi:hypothetical protein
LNPLARIFWLQVTSALGCHRLTLANEATIQSSNPVASIPFEWNRNAFTSSKFLKNSRSVQASELNIQSSALPDSCFLTPDSW